MTTTERLTETHTKTKNLGKGEEIHQDHQARATERETRRVMKRGNIVGVLVLLAAVATVEEKGVIATEGSTIGTQRGGTPQEGRNQDQRRIS